MDPRAKILAASADGRRLDVTGLGASLLYETLKTIRRKGQEEVAVATDESTQGRGNRPHQNSTR